MPKVLKFWNGAGSVCRKSSDPLWHHLRFNQSPHAYVAAYSRADARRVIEEYCGRLPSDNELREYWSECWGNAMNGIVPERGLWLQFKHSQAQVVRVL